jgi:hypothetical protein
LPVAMPCSARSIASVTRPVSAQKRFAASTTSLSYHCGPQARRLSRVR